MTHNNEMEEAYNQQSGYKNENLDDLTAAEEEEEEFILPEERSGMLSPLYTVPGPLPDGEKGVHGKPAKRTPSLLAYSIYMAISSTNMRKPDLDSPTSSYSHAGNTYGQSVNIREPEKSGEFEKGSTCAICSFVLVKEPASSVSR